MPRRRSLLFPAITALLLFIGIIGSLWALRPPASTQVEIVQNGITIYRLDLLREPDHTISVCYNDGCNLIEIENHQIRILDADCPDQTCVHMGWLSENGLPIVCLPNRLVIRFTQSSGETDALA